jgi:transposase
MKKQATLGGMDNILYVGIDLHERESQLAIFEKDGALVEERRLATRELASFLSSLPGEKRVAIESVGFVYPIYDKLSSLQDCTVTVANVNRLQLISRSSTKHDSADARILGDLLRTNYLPVAHMRDEETGEKLVVVQERVNYGVKRAELRGSVRWLLTRRGIDVEKPFGPEGKARPRELHLQEVDDRLAELDLVESFVERLDAQIADIASRDHRARLLDTLPGLGAYTALYLACALDDVGRFPDSKQACAYLGLVPWLDESADTRHLGHITKKGDKWLRRNLVECAAVAVRKDPPHRVLHQAEAQEREEEGKNCGREEARVRNDGLYTFPLSRNRGAMLRLIISWRSSLNAYATTTVDILAWSPSILQVYLLCFAS